MLVGDLMEIHLHHAQSLGEFIRDGRHKPFRALACPLKPAVLGQSRGKKSVVGDTTHPVD